MNLQIKPRSRGAKPHSRTLGERSARIEGSFRRISVHQLTLAWWLYAAGHITKRQYRLYFAAHELAERRRYTSPEHRGAKPLYKLREFTRLLGGQGSEKAARELRGDMKRLTRLGLVTITKHSITFAVSADQITLGSSGGVDDLDGFWSMFNAMPNRRRSVPVPRRLLRALAAGFSKGVTALVSAVLIRGLYWHKESSDYRTDGRYKLSWVAEHFGISRRAATDARNKLIELGWIEPLSVNQWEMNAWGVRDRIVPEWSHTNDNGSTGQSGTATAVGGAEQAGEGGGHSASPNRNFAPHSASPDLTDSLSLTGDQKTRRLPERERSGVSQGSTFGSRKKNFREKRRRHHEPNIRDVQASDLGDMTRLLELHQQACSLGLASTSEAGRLDFIAMAQRARCRGKRAGALFFWLLREKKTAFITHSDEEDAARMLREHLNGPQKREPERGQWWGARKPEPQPFSERDQTVMACIQVGKKHRLEPHRVARQSKGWTRPEWDEAYTAFQCAQLERVQQGRTDLSVFDDE